MSVDVLIDVSAEDPGAEVFLLDRTFRIVNKGIGKLAVPTTQPPGLYRARARIGTSVRETHLVVEPGHVRLVGAPPGIHLRPTDDEQSVHVHFDALQFSSPLPLRNTSRSHEYHRDSAESVSTSQPQVVLGTGAHMFLYARAWSSGDGYPYRGWNPAEGLSLVAIGGEVLFDFARTKTFDLTQDPWAACRLELAPGPYRLRYALHGRITEMSLMLSRSWQLHVFLLAPRSAKGERRLELASAAIFHSRGGFTDGSGEARLCEQVRFGLAQRRRTMSWNELEELVHEKFDNPMLGIYGAHMMLMSDHEQSVHEGPRDLSADERAALKIITRNLTNLLGVHPDVEALRLFLGQAPARDAFHCPPMLLSSWEMIVRATRERPELIPSQCLSAHVASRVISSAPWLQWNARAFAPHDAPGAAERNARSRVAEYLELLQQVQHVELPSIVVPFSAHQDLALISHAIAFADPSTRPETDMHGLAAAMVDALGLPMSTVLDALGTMEGQAQRGDSTTKHVFHAFNGYVAQVTGRTSCLFWTDDPSDKAINWDIKRAFPVDLALSVSAARQGKLPWDQVQVDDHSLNGGLTSIGPQFPGGSVIGAVWLYEPYMRKLGLTTASKPQHAFDYELRTVMYTGDKVYGDRRFHGFHAEIVGQPALAASTQVTRLKVWNPGTGKEGGPAPMWWLDLNDVANPSESTVAARGAGSLYIDADKRLVAFSGGGWSGPKLPKGLGY